jgi:hypothetical protein
VILDNKELLVVAGPKEPYISINKDTKNKFILPFIVLTKVGSLILTITIHLLPVVIYFMPITSLKAILLFM